MEQITMNDEHAEAFRQACFDKAAEATHLLAVLKTQHVDLAMDTFVVIRCLIDDLQAILAQNEESTK